MDKAKMDFMRHYVFLVLSCVGWGFLEAIHLSSPLTSEKELAPGEEYEEVIEIVNKKDDIEDVSIFIKDYSFNAKGETSYLDPGSLERSNGSWITLENNKVIVAKNGSLNVKFKVKVPEDKELNGTYWSLIMVEPVIRAKPTDGANVGIAAVTRYGVQIISHIKDTGYCDFKVVDPQVVVNKGKATYQFVVDNVGTQSISPKLWMELVSETGENFGPIYGVKTRLYPGTAATQRFELSTLKPGRYKGLIVFDEKRGGYFGSQCEFVVPEIESLQEETLTKADTQDTHDKKNTQDEIAKADVKTTSISDSKEPQETEDTQLVKEDKKKGFGAWLRNFGSKTSDAQEASSAEDTQEGEIAQDNQNITDVQETELVQATQDAQETKQTEIAKDLESSQDKTDMQETALMQATHDAQETKDTEIAEDGRGISDFKDATAIEMTEDVESSQDIIDIQESELAQDAKESQEIQPAEITEEATSVISDIKETQDRAATDAHDAPDSSNTQDIKLESKKEEDRRGYKKFC